MQPWIKTLVKDTLVKPHDVYIAAGDGWQHVTKSFGAVTAKRRGEDLLQHSLK